MQRYRIYTTRGHVATIQAESIEHAHRLFTAKEFPPGVRPAPTHPETGTAHVPYEGFAVHGSAAPVWDEWQRWYRDEFLPARAAYPTLDECRGECMSRIVLDDASPCNGTFDTSRERPYGYCCAIGGCGSAICPECGGLLIADHNSFSCDSCQMLWPHEYIAPR